MTRVAVWSLIAVAAWCCWWMTGCAPKVTGGWFVLQQTVTTCPTPLPTPL